jgi:galactokinase
MAAVHIRYPGRALVLGDHCDWAGGCSLTIPLPLGIELTAEPGTTSISVHSELDGEVIEGRWPVSDPRRDRGPLRFVPAAIKTLEEAGISLAPVDLWLRSDLPAGRGFSSSAAFSLAILDGLSRMASKPLPLNELVELAYRLEHHHLGVACGRLDPAACAAAQPLFTHWAATQNDEMEMTARRISPLGVLHFVIGAFSSPRDTAGILSTLSRHHASQIPDPKGDAVREALTDFSSAAEAGAHAMSNGNAKELGLAMNRCQATYDDTLAARLPKLRAPALQRTCTALLSAGALGAKFSGAGGDGSVLALFEEENAARAGAIMLEEIGLQAWYCPIGAP